MASLLEGCSARRPPPALGLGLAPAAPRAVRPMASVADSTGGTIEYEANVCARTKVSLRFRVPGKMLCRSAEVGQRVRAGQALAQLDATDLRLAQITAAAATRAAQATLDVVQAGYAASTAPGAVLGVGVGVGVSVVRLSVDLPRDAAFTVPENSLPAMRSVQGQAGALHAASVGHADAAADDGARKRDARLMREARFLVKLEPPPPPPQG